MLYLDEPKRIKSLLRVCILASAGLSEPPLVDDHEISNKILCTGSIRLLMSVANCSKHPKGSRKTFRIVKMKTQKQKKRGI